MDEKQLVGSYQRSGGLVMVQEEVWEELRRLAGLDRRISRNTISAVSQVSVGGNGGSSTVGRSAESGFDVDLEKGEESVEEEPRRRRKRVKREEKDGASCCGICVIC